MRAYVLAFAAMALFSISSSTRAENVPNGGRDFYGYAAKPSNDMGKCQELRQACLRKSALGEESQGNCKWFRRNCP